MNFFGAPMLICCCQNIFVTREEFNAGTVIFSQYRPVRFLVRIKEMPGARVKYFETEMTAELFAAIKPYPPGCKSFSFHQFHHDDGLLAASRIGILHYVVGYHDRTDPFAGNQGLNDQRHVIIGKAIARISVKEFLSYY